MSKKISLQRLKTTGWKSEFGDNSDIDYICAKQLLAEIFSYLKTQLTTNHELQGSAQEEILSNKIMWYEIRKLMQIKYDGASVLLR